MFSKTLALDFKRPYFLALEVIYIIIVSSLLVLLCTIKFSATTKIFLALLFALSGFFVGVIHKNLLYFTLFAVAFKINFFKIPTVSGYTIPIGLDHCLVIILLLVLIAHKLSQKDIKIRHNVFTTPLLILFLVSVASIVVAQDKKLSLFLITFMLEGAIIYLYILTFFRSENDLRGLLIALFITTLFYSIFSILQFRFSQIPIIGGGEIKTGIKFWGTRTGGGLAGGPNSLAKFIVITIPILFILYKKKRLLWNIFLSGAMIILFCSLALTYSRSGYISFLLSSLIFAVLMTIRYKQVKIFFYFITGTFLLFMIVMRIAPLVWGRFLSLKYFLNDPSAIGRLMLWRGAITTFLAHPIIGVGIANFVHEPAAVIAGFSQVHAHCLYLNVLAELGILGFLSLVFLIFTIFRTLMRNFTSLTDPFLTKVNICLITAWVAFFTHNIFDEVWGIISHSREIKYSWILLAITASVIQLSNQKDESISKRQ